MDPPKGIGPRINNSSMYELVGRKQCRLERVDGKNVGLAMAAFGIQKIVHSKNTHAQSTIVDHVHNHRYE
tara:strand:- start:638 stop:847 length:210 start_codon:yes stop_codon:yes gene_type:complete